VIYIYDLLTNKNITLGKFINSEIIISRNYISAREIPLLLNFKSYIESKKFTKRFFSYKTITISKNKTFMP